jgi:hypothetical protein
MYIHGHFYNRNEEKIEVFIVTNGDRSKELLIGNDSRSDLFFSADGVELKDESTDTFDHLLKNQARITLLCRNYIGELFTKNCKDAVVNIYRGGKCLFAGFIEPQAYSQGYNEEYDELELTCVDALCALEYGKYKKIGYGEMTYGRAVGEACQRSFGEVMDEILTDVTREIDIVGGGSVRLMYDGSKALTGKEEAKYSILNDISINELLFMGDSEDDVWTEEEVVVEMLKYLNLHMVQDGLTFWLFDWETMVCGQRREFRQIWKDGDGVETSTHEEKGGNVVRISNENVADCDTSISVGEVWNEMRLKCDVKSISSVIESPLDEDLLRSPFINKQKYMTEYSSDGEGEKALAGFVGMIFNPKHVTYDAATMTDWYVWVMSNKAWRFRNKRSEDVMAEFCIGGVHQERLLNASAAEAMAMVLKMGKIETKWPITDNSPKRATMKTCMVISVNGNGKDSEKDCYPNEASLLENAPLAVYEGQTSGGVYSPVDDVTTNYIVISGKIGLTPLSQMTATFKEVMEQDTYDHWHKTVPSRTNGDGRYYTQKYWCAELPTDVAVWDEGIDHGMIPLTDNGPQEYKFNYSYKGDGGDKISKVPVIACMLRIGDKVLVEDESEPAGAVEKLKWQKFKERQECESDDEYYQQCFTIGFDPKIGDYLIGGTYDIQNNITDAMSIDASGMAIPIRRSDKLSGRVRFEILGPANLIWNEVVRHHPSFWRHTKWETKSVPLMSHVSNIVIEDFEMKLYSDNGQICNWDENADLVYVSNTDEKYVNCKDDIEMKISSALTSDECKALSVKNTIAMSTPLDVRTGYGLTSIYNQILGCEDKAEKMYVDSYWRECHEPRVVMLQNFVDKSDVVDRFSRYVHSYMGKTFYVVGVSRNLYEGTAQLKLKEIWQ